MTDIIEMIIIDNELFRFSMITLKGNSCFLSIPKKGHISIINFDIKAGTSDFIKDVNNTKNIVERAFKKHDLENNCLVIPILPKDYNLVSIDDYKKLMDTIDSLFNSVKSILDDKNISYENVIGIVSRKEFELFLDWYSKSTNNEVRILYITDIYIKKTEKEIITISGKTFERDDNGGLQLVELKEIVDNVNETISDTLEEQPIVIEDMPNDDIPNIIYFDSESQDVSSTKQGISRTLALPGIGRPSIPDGNEEKLNYTVTQTQGEFESFYKQAGHIAFKLVIALGIILYLVIIGVILTKN